MKFSSCLSREAVSLMIRRLSLKKDILILHVLHKLFVVKCNYIIYLLFESILRFGEDTVSSQQSDSTDDAE